jgi:hypothetical protein
VIGGHGAAVQHVIDHVGRLRAVVQFLADHMACLDRVCGRYVVGDALLLEDRQKFVVLGVGMGGRDCC